MTLIMPETPKEAPEVFVASMERLREVEPALAGATIESLDATAPLEIYVLGLDALRAKDLSKAEKTGWRFVVLRDRQPVGLLDYDWTGEPAKLELSSFNTGVSSREVVRGIQEAEKLPQVEADDFVPRALEVLELYLLAVWLHGEESDLLLPIEPTPESLDAYKAYTPDELMSLLADAASERKRSRDFERGPLELESTVKVDDVTAAIQTIWNELSDPSSDTAKLAREAAFDPDELAKLTPEELVPVKPVEGARAIPGIEQIDVMSPDSAGRLWEAVVLPMLEVELGKDALKTREEEED